MRIELFGLFGLIVLPKITTSKIAIFHAKKFISNEVGDYGESFEKWLSLSDDVPTILFAMNPGVLNIECVEGNRYRGYLKPLQFPFGTVISTIEYVVAFDKGRRIAVSCDEAAIKQTFEGLFKNTANAMNIAVIGSGEFILSRKVHCIFFLSRHV